MKKTKKGSSQQFLQGFLKELMKQMQQELKISKKKTLINDDMI